MQNLRDINFDYSKSTACVLASGPTLEEDLRAVAEHGNLIYFAVNSSILACPNADYFVSDDEDVAGWSYFWNEVINAKCKVLLYADKFIKHGLNGICEQVFKDRLYWFKHKQECSFSRPYLEQDKNTWIGNARCSVASAMFIAYAMGFNKAILIGLNGEYSGDDKYFYDSWAVKPHRISRRLKPIIKTKTGVNATDTDLLETNEYWAKFASAIPQGFSIYNASKRTIIKEFKVWDVKV